MSTFIYIVFFFFFFQAEDGIRDAQESRGLGDVYKRQEDLGLHAKAGLAGRAGLQGGGARQRRDHEAAGLGLPPRVDQRDAALADPLVVPEPAVGVDRLADRTHDAQGLHLVLLRPLVALACLLYTSPS